MYYYTKARQKPNYELNIKRDGHFDPHYVVSNFTESKVKTAQDVEEVYNSVDFERFNNKKFVLGDYTFYGCGRSVVLLDDGNSERKFEFSFYMDFMGFRKILIKFESYKYDKSSSRVGDYGKSFKGYLEFLELLDSNDIELLDYELDELAGPYGVSELSNCREFHMTPTAYRQVKGSGYGENTGKIDIDYFIKLETIDGVYKPSGKMLKIIFNNFDNRNVLKSMNKKITSIGVHTIHFRKNTDFDIEEFYNLSGVEVKAPQSILNYREELLPYVKNDKMKAKIKAKKLAEEKARLKEIADDTFSLTQNGKTILGDVRSAEITEYIEAKESNKFELQVIAAGKQCFKVMPDLERIFFIQYGIYTMYEMAGEKFVHDEDLKNVNKLMDIKLSKKLIDKLNDGDICPPTFSEDDTSISFDKGASFIGAMINAHGDVSMIEESGDQGI
jgi:hypothetical protein